MFTPIHSNEFFVKITNSSLSQELEDLLSFFVYNIQINIVQEYVELKLIQSEEYNVRKIIKFLSDSIFEIELYEGQVYPDYKRKLHLYECKIIDHQERFNYSDLQPNYNYIIIKFERYEEEENVGDEG